MKKYIKNSLLLLSMFAAFTSAAQKNTPAVPENFRNSSPVDTSNIADIKWKQFFTETDLIALITAGLKENSDLQLAEKNLNIANLQFKQAKWGSVPQLNAYADASSTRLSDNSLNGQSATQALGQHHVEDYSTGLALSWEADIWGKIRNSKKSALASYMRTTEARKALQTTVVSSISNGFYDLLTPNWTLQGKRSS